MKSITERWSAATLADLPVIAQALLAQLPAGAVVGLDGPMGVGKTTLVQAMAQALNISERVNSPTFNLLHDYTSGTRPVLHVDLYRLGPEDSARVADELFDWMDSYPDGLTLIEWAEYGLAENNPWLAPALTHQVALHCNAQDVRELTLYDLKLFADAG